MNAAIYPAIPGFKTPGPSESAAIHAGTRANLLRSRVLGALSTQGALTADECAESLGESVLSIRPRFSELVALGELLDSGLRRRNASGRLATVWRLREIGQLEFYTM